MRGRDLRAPYIAAVMCGVLPMTPGSPWIVEVGLSRV